MNALGTSIQLAAIKIEMGEYKVKVGRILLAATAMLLAHPAMAQAQDAEGRLVFEPGFFAAFSPSNAQQMVERLPGFVLEAGDTEVRGFSQAAGNVVINGQRPSAKEALQNILQRIPASRVVRIEIVAGNAFGADYAGKPQVANVVLSDAGGVAGNVDGRLTREYTGRLLPRGNASVVVKSGASTFSGALTYQQYNMGEESGFDRAADLAPGSVVETRKVNSRNVEPFWTGSLGWAHDEAADRSFHINAKATADKWTIHQTNAVDRDGVYASDSLYVEDHLWHIWELSGDVTRPLAGGAIKLNLLGTHRHRRNDDWLSRQDLSGSLGGSYQDFDDWRSERVARLAWTRSTGGWALEMGGEGAYNRLKTDLELYDVAPSGGMTRVDLPIDQAIVDEYRAETFINAGRNIASNLRLDLGLNYEISRLTVTGDANARRVLKFWKPKVAFDWASNGWHAQFSVKRTVAQLNFGDFVSATSFTTNQNNAGNAELEPQRKWEALLSADRTILGDGRVKIELGHQRVSQVQDRIPVAGGDAPGNLGNGEIWIARTNLDLPLSGIGIKGGRLSLYGSYVDTNVQDPYTLLDRQFTGQSVFAYTADFRQDLGKFAWGVSMSGNTGATYFRRTETDEMQGISPKVNAFAEYRPSTRTTFSIGAENLTDSAAKRWRQFYAPDRKTAAPFREEFRLRGNHTLVYVAIKHSFG
jgi:hypothetical protein